ncbi:MAG: 23S rRNA (adenine(2503)-C(2))-methyltransferase RlmN [Thermoflexales bacterium]|nr:23S rRNA (adenine(2503)-C(2))-methyltransferase RlmN [Thermoflexales bacterium]
MSDTATGRATPQPGLYDLEPAELVTQLEAWGEKPFRARQISTWLYQRFTDDPAAMTDLPAPLRQRLGETFAQGRFTQRAEQVSTDGWTRKWLLALPDGAEIEVVLMEYDGQRRTACISSQAGCAMGCSFCATGQMGFLRNLRAGEIVEQVMWVSRALAARGERLSNLVLMGMGEPFANFTQVMAALDTLTRPEDAGGYGLGARRITVSTVGLVPGIERFAERDSQVNLAVSLHAATDALRATMLPVNQRYPLDALARAIGAYQRRTNRRVSLEWALIDGVNDTPEQAEALVDFVRRCFDPRREGRHLTHVNAIPLNPTSGFVGAASRAARIAQFREILDRAGIPNTVRQRRGIDIAAGCGQLRKRAAGGDPA